MKRGTIKSTFILIITLSTIFTTINYIETTSAIDPYFTLVAKTHGGGYIPDIYNLIKQFLVKIGINVDVYVCDWPTFVSEIITFHDYDIISIGLSGGERYDPDFTGVYNENGSLNIFGYNTEMDYNETLGTGTNEWYMKQGTLIMPPNSQERIHHYWAWEQYMMDKILPCLPLFVVKKHNVQWANLQGYNFSDGIVQSWGKMSFDGTHTGQIDNTELVTTDAAWSNLNPLFQDDSSSAQICQAIMDPLMWIDNDRSIWPHLAKSITLINDTYVRIETRNGIKWQDPGGYADEYFDAEDVYFTLFSLKNLADNQFNKYDWIEDMKIINKRTLDIFIDGNTSTTDNEIYTPFLGSLCVEMLPEHYLNVTQLADGKTPNINHENWDEFASNAFGTGLFEIGSFTEGVETELTVFPDCWKLDPAIDKSNMDFVNRFGDFTGGLDTWRIVIIPDPQTALLEFEAGKTDCENLYSYDQKDSYLLNPELFVQEKLVTSLMFAGFNMRSNRPVIGNPDLVENGSMTVGLAVRKAICYAVDREEINDIIFNNNYLVTNYPIYQSLGIWCNPNIIKYDQNLALAKQFMELAGFKQLTPTAFISYFDSSFILGTIVLLLIIDLKKRKRTL
ncbi:MAG: ABC transporter substrate-binding protein [Candidatus Thorarchaeota archaeon]